MLFVQITYITNVSLTFRKKTMRKLSIDLPDEMYKELATIKFQKMLEDNQTSIGDLIRQAIREWLEKERLKKEEK
jgi:metal-responsive CopG/Arc/MetJ family transcriptional regulator